MGDKHIGLVRVSTRGQEESGLGLLAGRDDIDRYIESVNGTLVTVLEEIESGTHDDLIKRPILLKALTLCKRHKAILLVPKIDRLVRSTQVHTDLKRSGVSFRAIDNPHANEFTLDILVAVAANEARAISDRTKKALKAYRLHKKVSNVQMMKLLIRYGQVIPPAEIDAATDKPAIGRLIGKYGHLIPADALAAVAGKLGSHLTGSNLTEAQRTKGQRIANANSSRKAIEVYEDLVDDMKSWRSAGMTLARIAEELNARGDRTRNGANWSKVQVKRTLDRATAQRERS